MTRPHPIHCLKKALQLACAAVIGYSTASAAANPARNLYNEGVGKLGANDLREAETAFRRAVETNHAAVQPAALFNLGHVRFLQGKETLKGEGNRQQLLDSSAAATALAEEVIRRGTPVAESEDIQELIGAYMEARAARKRLRITRDENTRELDLLGSALSRWRRSVGDFRSAHELAQNEDAKFNADVVERHIDELLKFKKKLEQEQENVGDQRQKLTDMMKKMRGKIPKEMQRGSDDEEDDDEDEPEEEGDKETAKQQQQRIGGEREIDPDMLRVLKERMPQRTMSVGQDGEKEMQGFRPDGTKPGDPKNRKGRDW